MEELRITINTYHEYMCEAFMALLLGLAYFNDVKDDDFQINWLCSNAKMQGCYAFLLATNALEAAANALL